jgi:hypothetical protein
VNVKTSLEGAPLWPTGRRHKPLAASWLAVPFHGAAAAARSISLRHSGHIRCGAEARRASTHPDPSADMIENPYLGPVFSPAQTDAWAEGFVRGYADSSVPIDPPPEIDQEAGAAYSEGIQAGRQGAIDGLDIGKCIAAGEPDPGEDFEHLITGADIAHGLWDAVKLGEVAAGLTSLVLLLIEIGCSAKAVLPLSQTMLPDAATPLLDAMNDYGVPSLEVYVGVGRDPLSKDCEIQLTGLYPAISSARDAVHAMGRSDWLIVSWRTDQSGSFHIVEAAPQ